jgi:hypothetical protein
MPSRPSLQACRKIVAIIVGVIAQDDAEPGHALVAHHRRRIAGTPWLDVFCPGCGTSRCTMVLGLRCSWCPGSAPMPKLLGLYALPPAGCATGFRNG